MRAWLAVLTFLGSLAFAGASNPASAGQCLEGLEPALLAGGFSGSIECEQDRLTLNHVGRLQKFGRTFQVYSYRYQLMPVCRDCAAHGGQRIIFMEDGRYVGQYKPDSVRAVIRNGDLILEVDGRDPVTVEFTRNGPSDELWVDGEVLEFFK